MNKLHEVLNNNPSQTRDQFEKAFRKVFGIPAEIENDDNNILFDCYGERFSLDYEGTLLWYRHKAWFKVSDIEEARRLWRA